MNETQRPFAVKALFVALAALLGGGVGGLLAFSTRHEKMDTEIRTIAAPPESESIFVGSLPLPSAPPNAIAELAPGLAEILALPTLEERMLAMRLWARRLEPAQAEEAFHRVLETRAHPNRAHLLSALVARWAEGDGVAVIDAVQRLPARERNVLLRSAYDGWSRSDPLAAWEAINALPRDDRIARTSIPRILANMAHVDLRAAFDLASQASASSAPGLGGHHLGAVVQAAAADGRLPEVLALLEALPSGQHRISGVQSAYAQWALTDGEIPLQRIAQVTDPELAKAAMNGFLSGWAQTDPMAALQFALDRHDDPLVTDALSSAVSSSIHNLADEELRTVLAQIVDRGRMGEVGRSLVPGLVHSGQGELAAESIFRMPASREREQLVGALMSMWPRVDLPAAIGYFERMPPGGERARALPTIGAAAVVADGSLARVQGWLARSAETERAEITTSLLVQLASQAGRLNESTRAELARLVADTPSLPPRVRERVVQAFGPPPGP
ncbi:hypothetical protein ASA1KI_12250 [Opitutales bacterium ASA1]|uniref:hypothetical protein n=1 Tax=Congregicoccus parvus TaxID=3081749 RepID=UPI002B30CDF5|nr:hypothetical protein ASA1KI_12250 [Opitutales bacterium ASA1]